MHFNRIGNTNLTKVHKDNTNMIIVTPAWQIQSWYPILLKMTIKNPIFLPNHPKVLLSPEGKIHPLIQNQSLRLVTRLVSGKVYLQKGYQKGLLTLSQVPEEQVLSQIMNRPGESELTRVIGSKLIPLVTI